MRHIAFSTKKVDGKFDNVISMAKLRYREDDKADLVSPEQVLRETQAQPEGMRCIQLVVQFPRNSQDVNAWLDKDSTGQHVPSAETYRKEHAQLLGEWFASYEAIGGHADYCLLDFEWSLDWNTVAKLRPDIEKTLDGPGMRWMLKSLLLNNCEGFRSWGSKRDQRELVWNRTLHAYVGNVLHDTIYKPIAAIFPRVKVANYEHFHYVNQIRAGSHRRYSQCWTDATGSHCGTHSGKPFYGQATPTTSPWSEAPEIENLPWDAFLQDVTWGKSVAIGSHLAGVPWMAWIPSYHQASPHGGLGFALSGTPLWSEQIRHLAANGCREFVLWHRKDTESGGAELSAVLNECDEKLKPDHKVDMNLALTRYDPATIEVHSGSTQVRRVTRLRPDKSIDGSWV